MDTCDCMNLKTIWKLAKQGNKKAQFELAERYEKAGAVDKALELYEIVAQKDIDGELDESFEAKCRLAKLYWDLRSDTNLHTEKILLYGISALADIDMVGTWHSKNGYLEKKRMFDNIIYLCVRRRIFFQRKHTSSNLNRCEQLSSSANLLLERLHEQTTLLGFDINLSEEVKVNYTYYAEDVDNYVRNRHIRKDLLKASDNYFIEDYENLLGHSYLWLDNEEKALKYFNQNKRYFQMGWIYKYGKHKQDYFEALRCFELAIEKGGDHRKEAMYELGELYYNGWGTPVNFEEAAKWYGKAIRNRYSPRVFFHNIGILYSPNANASDLSNLLEDPGYTYPDVAQKEKIAEYYNGLNNKLYSFLYCYATLLCYDVDADYIYYYDNKRLAVRSYYPESFPESSKRGVQFGCLRYAAESWTPFTIKPTTIANLDNIYSFIRDNEEEVLEWFRQENSFEFYYFLGLLYKTGKGFKQDYSKALEAFNLALEAKTKENSKFELIGLGGSFSIRGDWKDFAKFELGEFNFYGWGTPINFEEAAKWYRQILENKSHHLWRESDEVIIRNIQKRQLKK